MDINDLRGLSTALLMIAFLGVCVWAYGKQRHSAFKEAANLPFADEELNRKNLQKEAAEGREP